MTSNRPSRRYHHDDLRDADPATTTPPPAEPLVERVLPGEARVAEAAHRSLTGGARGLRAVLPFLGPAFVAAVAYVDPGNFATNVAAGSQFGYMLLWVILASNLMAMLIQTMSAKLGIATGHEPARGLPRPLPHGRCRAALWVQAEVIAMATDLAEFLGAALGFNLLFGIPLFWAGVLTGVFSFAILALQSRGARPLEIAITMLVGVILVGFAVQFVLSDPSASGIARGASRCRSSRAPRACCSATGILGATVMPHVIYLHSALTQRRVVGRTEEERQRIFRFERIDVIIAMSIAGVINMSMLIMAAGVFHSRGLTGVEDIDEVFHRLGDLVGSHAQYRLRRGAAGVRTVVVLGRDARRPGGDAGLHRPADPALPAPRPHDGAGAGRPGDRRQPEPRAGAEPGRALVRHPVRADPAARLLPAARHDGRAGEPPLHDRRGDGGRRAHRRA